MVKREAGNGAKPEDVLFPAREIRLLSGKMVVVRPWGLEKGRFMLERLVELFQKMGPSVTDAKKMIDVAYDETLQIVRDTIEWSEADFAELAFEDALDLTQAVIEVCLVRPDGGGALGKVLELLKGATSLMQGVAMVSGPSSTSSSPAGTRSRQ